MIVNKNDRKRVRLQPAESSSHCLVKDKLLCETGMVTRTTRINGYCIEQLGNIENDQSVMDFPFTLSLEFNSEQKEWIDLHMNKESKL